MGHQITKKDIVQDNYSPSKNQKKHSSRQS